MKQKWKYMIVGQRENGLMFIIYHCPSTHRHHWDKEMSTNSIEYNEPNGKKTRLKYLSVLLSLICYRLIVDPLIHNYFYSICLLSSFIFFLLDSEVSIGE